MSPRESHDPPAQVLILGLDTFARKNVAQIRSLEAEGYAFTVVTNDQRGDSRAIFDAQVFAASRLIVVRGVAERLRTAWRLLSSGTFHHVELSAVGRLAVAYLAMLKALRRPFIVIERGDVGGMGEYGFVVRSALKTGYRWAELVVYKETYMEALLRRFTRAPLLFVPNSAASPAESGGAYEDRKIDFLWVNRLTLQRRPEWLVRSLGDPRLRGRTAALLGFEERANLPGAVRIRQDEIRRLARDGVSLLDFADPEPSYRQAKFFCLPAALIFGNNSLLEAMAHGVVPVVTESPGIDLVVEDGVNGIVTAFDEQSYKRGLLRAAAMAPEEWARLSQAARSTVARDFSPETWRRRMVEAYRRVGSD